MHFEEAAGGDERRIATAKAVRTQRLKSPLGMQSAPARTNQKDVLMNLATALSSILPSTSCLRKSLLAVALLLNVKKRHGMTAIW
jgi:hypothetical protein